MELEVIVELITTVGFPIAVCIALFWFIYHVYKASEKREDELREEIKENQKTNKEAIKTLALYAERLDVIQGDVEEIKNNIAVLTN